VHPSSGVEQLFFRSCVGDPAHDPEVGSCGTIGVITTVKSGWRQGFGSPVGGGEHFAIALYHPVNRPGGYYALRGNATPPWAGGCREAGREGRAGERSKDLASRNAIKLSTFDQFSALATTYHFCQPTSLAGRRLWKTSLS